MPRHALKYVELTDEKYERIQRIRRLVHLESDKFIQKHFKVPDDATGRPLDFKFRWAQQRAYDIYKEELRSGKPVRLWFLKSRRVGLTSIFAADDLLDAWANENKRVGIVAHNDERARRILAICKFYYKRMPPSLRVPLSKDATAGLKFADHDSELVIGTCREPAKIRGDGLQRAHLSEAAWYGNNFSRVMQEVAMTVAPEPGTAIIIETTGRDRGSSCHKHWAAARAGENQYRAEFIPWIEDPTASTTFDSDMHKRVILDELLAIEPRLYEKCRFYKLTPEKMHWAYRQYIYRAELDYEFFCREFPVDEEEAWTSEGSSFFGDNEIGQMRPSNECLFFSFKNRFINQIFTSFADLEEVKKVEDNGSTPHIKLWKGPQQGRQYVIGGDSSLGEAGSTFSAGYVIDMATREMMCAYHGRIRPDEHAYLLASLGTIYNNATVAPEVNPGGGGISILTDLQRLGYYNIYIWRKRDSNKGLLLTNSIGWWTTNQTRPTMLGELRKMFQDCAKGRFDDPGMFRDKALLDEMRSFHVDPDTARPAATGDAFDDRILALAIAHRVAADEVIGGHLDIYASYDKVETTQSKLVDQWNEAIEASIGPDPADVISDLMDGNFKLNGGRIEWE